MKSSAITPAIASAIERPIHHGVHRPFGGGRRKSISARFADILKGRTAIVYDPQDLTTMYRDAAGTQPVYKPGTGLVDPPVGLMLDKGQGLELGPELWSAQDVAAITDHSGTLGTYNSATREMSNTLLGTVSSYPRFRFSVGVNKDTWHLIECKFVGNINKVVGVFNLGNTSLVNFGNGVFRGVYNPATFNQGSYDISVFTEHSVWSGLFVESISIREIKGYHAYQSTTTARPTLSGRYNLLTATETLSTQSVTTVATNYTLRFEGTGTITLSGTATGTYSAGTHTITCTAGTLTLTVAGSVTRADLRVKRDGSSLPAYQSVTNANTYDTAGFPLFLKRDKVDDDLIVRTPAITGQAAWGSIETVDIAAATIAAGEYKPFGTITAGEPTCTQWIAIDGTLTAAEQAILERYVYSKSKLPAGA